MKRNKENYISHLLLTEPYASHGMYMEQGTIFLLLQKTDKKWWGPNRTLENEMIFWGSLRIFIALTATLHAIWKMKENRNKSKVRAVSKVYQSLK